MQECQYNKQQKRQRSATFLLLRCRRVSLAWFQQGRELGELQEVVYGDIETMWTKNKLISTVKVYYNSFKKRLQQEKPLTNQY